MSDDKSFEQKLDDSFKNTRKDFDKAWSEHGPFDSEVSFRWFYSVGADWAQAEMQPKIDALVAFIENVGVAEMNSTSDERNILHGLASVARGTLEKFKNG